MLELIAELGVGYTALVIVITILLLSLYKK
jgi:hypothetical protein